MSQFTKTEIKDKLILSLFFKRNEEKTGLLDLYLVGCVSASFSINEDGSWKKENNAVIADKVMITPTKNLQKLIGKKLKFDEIRKSIDTDKQLNELISQIFYKLNKIYAKKKLYGKEIRDFTLL